MKKNLVKISTLTFDAELYPRIKVGWLTAYRYAEETKAGAEFPAIVVGLFEGKKYVVDGWHRVEARKLLKEDYIEANTKNYESKKDMFLDSIKFNGTHGRQLSIQEKVRLIDKLKNMQFSIEQITEIVQIPLDKIERFEARTIIGPNGKAVYLKGLIANSGATKTELLAVDQSSLGAPNVSVLLAQLIELLESDVFPLVDEKIKEASVHLYHLLGEKLEL